MTLRKNMSTAVLSLAATVLASQAHAFAVTDAAFQNPSAGFDGPIAVQSGKGKPRMESINTLSGLFAGGEWSLLDKTNKQSSPYRDVTFVLSADTRQKSGDLQVNWDVPDLSPYMDYIVLLKGGKQWGAYLFQAGGISPVLQGAGGKFETSWLNKKGKIAKLRYASIYGRVAAAPVVVTDIPVVVTDASAVVTDTPTFVTDTPAVAIHIPVVVTDTPSVVIDTPSVVTDTPAVAIDTPSVVTDNPPVVIVTPPAVAQSPTVVTNPPVVPTNPPVVVTDSRVVPDPNLLPLPGSLALVGMGLVLGLTQLRRREPY